MHLYDASLFNKSILYKRNLMEAVFLVCGMFQKILHYFPAYFHREKTICINWITSFTWKFSVHVFFCFRGTNTSSRNDDSKEFCGERTSTKPRFHFIITHDSHSPRAVDTGDRHQIQYCRALLNGLANQLFHAELSIKIMD